MKKFVLRFIASVIFSWIGLVAYNYTFDTTGLYNTDFSYPRLEPCQHFIKMRYILDVPEKYNAFCFGSSRVGNIDLTKIDDGYSYYNMTYSEGVPEEWLEDLKIMLRHGVSVKKILLGIDDFSFKFDPKDHEKEILRIPYHDDGNLKTYLTILFKPPRLPVSVKDKGSIYDIYGTGRPLHENPDIKIENDVSMHIKNPKFNNPPMHQSNERDRINETIAAMASIKELCDKHGIEIIVFFNPIHKTIYLDNDLDKLREFKLRLATVTDYYDFSGLNDITVNNYYYYEVSHYRPIVGEMIIHRIHNGTEKSNFGIYVTKNNVNQHLKNLQDNVRHYKK